VRSATSSVRAGFCDLDEFKFTPEKQALQAQHISISGPTGAGEKSTLLAELRTELP
jgi:ABC-type transport system involved in cytochrome bd biosynthesis fused ATPase/permease subunit